MTTPANRKRDLARSTLARPQRPQVKNIPKALRSAQVEEVQTNENSLLGLVQYLSSGLKTEVSVTYSQTISQNLWSIAGHGRTYVVRRVSTGTSDDMYEADFFRPSVALKSLRSFVGCSSHEISSRYRSLIQELRILRHRPLADHPNFSKIIEIGWERDAMNLEQALPTITTEFSTWGPLNSFLFMMEEHDWQMKSRLLLDVVEGLTALHACGIVHGDMKMENILVFKCTTDPDFPAIAKLSDFGFSLCLPEEGEYVRLVGYTPLWAAPEASQRLKKDYISLTDVYSLGFIVWSVCIGGVNPFEELHELAEDRDERAEVFNFFRESNEMLNVAKVNIVNRSHSTPIEVPLACDYLGWTLQYAPEARRLDSVLTSLRETSYRRKGENLASKPFYHPIAPLNKNMQIFKKFFWNTPWSIYTATRQISNELKLWTQKSSSAQSGSAISSKELNYCLRYSVESASNQAVAAMNLAYKYIYARNSGKSIDNALQYLCLAAHHGLGFAQWVCLRLRKTPGMTMLLEKEKQWTENAARAGLKLILADLKTSDSVVYHDCLVSYKTLFWATIYDVSDEDVKKLNWKNDLAASADTADNDNFFTSKRTCGNSILHIAALLNVLEPLQIISASKRVPVDTLNDREETPLFLSCRCGNTAAVEYLLVIGADASKVNKFGQNSLHWLDSFEEHEIPRVAKLLYDHGANPNQFAKLDDSFFGEKSRLFFDQWIPGTPLHRVVVRGNITAVQSLLGIGAQADLVCNGFTPIDRAAQFHRADMLEILLESASAFDLNRTTSESGMTPLHRAIVSADPFLLFYLHGPDRSQALSDTINVLFKKGVRISKLGLDPIFFAVSQGASEALALMLQHENPNLERRQIDGDLTTWNSLLESVKYEDEEAFEILLRHGADPHALLYYGQHTRFSALHLCVYHNHEGTRIMQHLLQAGVDVNHNESPLSSDTPLFYALHKNHFHLTDVLLNHGALLTACSSIAERGNVLGEILYGQPDRTTFNALQYLAKHPVASRTMPHYIHKGRRVTVFHMICGLAELRRRTFSPADFFLTFTMLREIFPDKTLLSSPDVCGFTPLHCAVYQAFPEAVQALLEAGADPFAHTEPDLSSELRDTDWITKPRIEIGISVMALVERGSFMKIHSGIDPIERQEFLERRQEVKDLLVPYTGWS